ncbi:MAG: hypothetical protein WBB98_13345 [Xanthobacteraceae bacterium]
MSNGWYVALVMIPLAVLIAVSVWPFGAAKPDPMAEPFGDWPNIDPRV